MNETLREEMLEYYKTVLNAVSFDPTLFRKELRKAFKALIEEDQTLLKNWLRQSSYL